MMGAGKSTTGQRLAQQLGYRFFDTDTLITQLTGQSINHIFAELGEAAFRQLETQVLAELSTYKQLVIATGGGIVLTAKNWSYLHHGLVLWLDVPVDQLWQRLRSDHSRPLLQAENPQQTLATLLAHRRPLYAQADLQITVPPGSNTEQVMAQIYQAIPGVVRSHKSAAASSKGS
ncbi:shikimate kinase [Synechococcales cyanobacterium C]|uniref:Shikimate kinase n=1 Tax=Petrachloros mirabilis ULC683 TaxID=2781853 RepID=A0A8K2A7D9_9CYAN|nr:shikimate kinase [Petrachloros mirabilis]NCJ06801.1 shikimate kinase [Petrachloros mirabilis ULC683]